MKVAEFVKQLEAKAAELRDVINALLKTMIDWEFRTNKGRHVVVLYTEYLRLSAELSGMLSAEINLPVCHD